MISPEELQNQLLEGIESTILLETLPLDIQDIICSRIGIAFSEHYDDLILAQAIIDLAQELSPKMTIIAFARIVELSKQAFDETLNVLNIRSSIVEKYWKLTWDFNATMVKGDKFGIEWRYN